MDLLRRTMSLSKYPISPDDQDRYSVDLGTDARFAVPLPVAPAELDTILRSGRWLILCFAVWSGPDRAAIDTALAVGRRSPRFLVGVRPFDSFAEFASWCPQLRETPRSPIWLVLHDGRLTGSLVGGANETDILKLLGDGG